jgi:glycerol-3-phosphate dehydrogenase (NAD(P)+)
MASMKRLGIVGAGAWGTALAMVGRRAGLDVVLQAHEPEVVAAVNRDHQNATYLKGVKLDPAIRAVGDPGEAAAGADAVLVVAPAQFVRGQLARLKAGLEPGVPVVICAKGIEQETFRLMSEIAAEVLAETPVAVLSGPTFAIEVAKDLPTGVTLAAADDRIAQSLADGLSTPRFRIYRSDDVVGVQIGGAVKNVIAIGCGVIEGRGLGDNARATLITRGLAEMARLGAAKGATPETLMGLAGIGDLTLTCNAMQSRNFSLGVALGRGERLADVVKARTSVAEGVFTAASVTGLARKLGVDMPICLAVDGILNHFADVDATIKGLLSRPTGVKETS